MAWSTLGRSEDGAWTASHPWSRSRQRGRSCSTTETVACVDEEVLACIRQCQLGETARLLVVGHVQRQAMCSPGWDDGGTMGLWLRASATAFSLPLGIASQSSSLQMHASGRRCPSSSCWRSGKASTDGDTRRALSVSMACCSLGPDPGLALPEQTMQRLGDGSTGGHEASGVSCHAQEGAQTGHDVDDGISRTAAVLDGSVMMPAVDPMWPRKAMLCACF